MGWVCGVWFLSETGCPAQPLWKERRLKGPVSEGWSPSCPCVQKARWRWLPVMFEKHPSFIRQYGPASLPACLSPAPFPLLPFSSRAAQLCHLLDQGAHTEKVL